MSPNHTVHTEPEPQDDIMDDSAEVTRVDQIAIAVEDLDEALAFYARAFGLRPASREVVEHDGIEEAMLDVGGVWIQLIAPARPDSAISGFLARRGPGLHHLGLAVKDLDGALDHLRREQVALIDHQPRPGGGGHQIAFVHPRGTGGVLIELIDEPSHADGGDGSRQAVDEPGR